MGHLAAAIELTWIVLVVESSVPTSTAFFPANSLDLSWSLNRQVSLPSNKMNRMLWPSTQAMVQAVSIDPIRIPE